MAERILLIEDDARLAEMVSEYLGEAGFRVSVARQGRSGLDRLAREPFDALVLDLMLPDMDGLEVCRELRAKSDVPLLMLTARGDAADRIVGLEIGADDYLPKPFQPRELLARLRAILRQGAVLIEGGDAQALHPHLFRRARESRRVRARRGLALAGVRRGWPMEPGLRSGGDACAKCVAARGRAEDRAAGGAREARRQPARRHRALRSGPLPARRCGCAAARTRGRPRARRLGSPLGRPRLGGTPARRQVARSARAARPPVRALRVVPRAGGACPRRRRRGLSGRPAAGFA